MTLDGSPDWPKFAWATFFFWSRGGDKDYQDLMRNSSFLQSIRIHPNTVDDAYIQEYLVRNFLNRWKSHVRNSPESARAIKKSIANMLPYLSALSSVSIKSVTFDDMIQVNGGRLSVGQAVEKCYQEVRATGYNIGPTATAKILHILNPQLFVMWDKPILDYLCKTSDVTKSSEGYRKFLGLMNRDAVSVSRSFLGTSLDPARQRDDDPETYLSRHMDYDPVKTMAKYLDEYNWATITSGVVVPPSWHP
jgi:hypothetical protein